MKSIDVALKVNPYKIVIDSENLSALGKYIKKLNIGADALVITNPLIDRLYGKQIKKGLEASGFSVKVFKVPDSETSKSAEVSMKLLEKVAKYDCLKKSFVVALGGGVIGDLAGFVAAVYKRGVPYVQVPTTLLAQVDSSIGGKVAIDLNVGKNLVGAFYQPKVVWSDVSVLSTLSKRQIRNGMAEVIKYGVIYDAKLFDYVERNVDKILSCDLKVVSHIVAECSRIKAEVVMADEKETKSIRTILNYGHTVGHAIEAAGKYSLYHHGEAIALGMRVAGEISVREGLFSDACAQRVNDLITAMGLPKTIKKIKMADILRIMKYDKKFITGQNRFVLATKIGKVVVKEAIAESVIKSSTKLFFS